MLGQWTWTGHWDIEEAETTAHGWSLVSKLTYLWSHGSEFELEVAAAPVPDPRPRKV